MMPNDEMMKMMTWLTIILLEFLHFLEKPIGFLKDSDRLLNWKYCTYIRRYYYWMLGV